MIFYLIGFMGSGKSTQGRRAARRLGMEFVDLDQWMEQRHGMSIPAIFSQHGEAAFREMERDALREVSQATGHLVMSAGGGTPCFHGNMDFMNAQGITLWLDVPAGMLAQRLRNARVPRPMLPTEPEALLAFIERKLEERLPFYSQAKVHLQGAACDAAGIEAAISERLS